MEQCSECGEGVVAAWSGLCQSLWNGNRPVPARGWFVGYCEYGRGYADTVDDECSPTPPDPVARARALGWERRPGSWCIPDRSGIMSGDLWLDYYHGPRWYITHITHQDSKGQQRPIDAGTDEADAVALALLLWDTVLM